MRVILTFFAVVAGGIAVATGFGWVNDPEWAEDFPGWLALAVTLFAAAHLPWDRYDRTRR